MPSKSGKGSKGKSSAPGGRNLKVRVKTAKGRRLSSTLWLERQLNDPYVAAAKRAGYRSRAAFKLLELDDKYKFLKPHARVLDLGAAPGGWTQVAVERVGSDDATQVTAIDILEMDPVPGAQVVQLDFMAADAPDKIMDLLGGKVDVVLSDMAPSTTGHRKTDHLRIIGLLEAALDFAVGCLHPGGAFVAKVFQGGSERDVLDLMKRQFLTVRHVKPKASRAGSAELYVVATGFRGVQGSGSSADR